MQNPSSLSKLSHAEKDTLILMMQKQMAAGVDIQAALQLPDHLLQ